MAHDSPASRWRTNTILTAAVIITVIMALLLSRLDHLQTRIKPTAVAQAAAIMEATFIPLPTPLPTETPSPTAANTAVPRVKPSATAVAIISSCGDVPNGWVSYEVQPDDTLFFLSLNSGASVDEITLANCLELNQLISGMKISLPSSPPVRVNCGPPASWTAYMVQPADTLFSLSRSRSTTVYAVMQANCLSSSYLVAGRQLYLPALPVTATWTPLPTNEPPAPTRTPQPTPRPTDTVEPTPPPPATVAVTPPPPDTPVPPASATPTSTLTTTPTATAQPATATPTATPTNTATSMPTATQTAPPPTNTPTQTPLPPTDTPVPPTATSTPTPVT